MIQREIGQQTIVSKERWSDIMDVISEYWEEDYYVTNVMHDGTDWIVIITEVPECRNQSLILNTDWGAFKRRVDQIYDNGMIVTKISCNHNHNHHKQ